MSSGVEVRAPLFERLVDLDPRSQREVRPKRTLDRAGLKASVRRELLRLFNSRCPLPARLLADREKTVIDYGIPDFSTFFPRNHDDRVRLAAALRRAVEAFEPRLRQVSVTLEPSADHLALSGRIEGVLVVDEVAEPVSFPTVFQSESGEVEIRAYP